DDKTLKLGGRHWHWHAPEVGKTLLDLEVGESGIYFLVKLGDDFGWRVLGRADALPRACLEARHRLADGWHVRQRLRALCGGHRERAHLAGLDGRNRL